MIDTKNHTARLLTAAIICKEELSLAGVGVVDKELLNTTVQAERKVFFISLRENPRGRVLRITEDVGGRRDTIMIPAPGLEAIRDVLDSAIQMHKNTPPTLGAQE